MTDKVQKIKEWISKEQDGLMDAQGNFEYPEHEGAYHILCNLDAYIDSLQEEPISEELEDAAYKFVMDNFGNPKEPLYKFDQRCFKAGAKWGKNQAMAEIQAQSMALAHGCPKEPVSENLSEKELARSYLAVFDKKYPLLPTLKGKQLTDFKAFLNKCQQEFGLKEYGIYPTQAKLFEKLTLLWAAWGAEHLQDIGKYSTEVMDEEHISDALSAEIEEIWGRHSFFNFDLMQNVASLSKKEITEIAHHFTNWQKQQMMKDAIEGYVNQIEYPGSTLIILSENPNELKNGEDVKLIIFKEE